MKRTRKVKKNFGKRWRRRQSIKKKEKKLESDTQFLKQKEVNHD